MALASPMGSLTPLTIHTCKLELAKPFDCRMSFPDGAVELASPGVTGRLPPARIFGREEYVIVRGRRRFEETTPGGTSRAALATWTLRMRRAR